MAKNLFQKVWDAHAVRELSNGQTQLLIGTHLIHEVTSPQAFGMLRISGLRLNILSGLLRQLIILSDQRGAFQRSFG